MENGKLVGILVGGMGLGGAIGFGLGNKLGMKKAGGSVATSDSSTCSVAGATPSTPDGLFELDGQVFTKDDFPSEAKDKLFTIQSENYETLSSFSKELAIRISLAKQAGSYDPQNLPQLRALIKIDPPSKEEMTKVFEANKGAIPPGMTFEKIQPQLVQFIESQKVSEKTRELVAEMESSGKIKVLLPAPQAPFVSLKLDAFPAKGNLQSSVTVVKVSDYLCPHCRHAVPEMEELMSEFEGKIKFVQANFALRPAGLSGMLAKGGFCAEQSKQEGAFWKFHHKAFEVPLEKAQSQAANPEVEYQNITSQIAKDIGLDTTAFNACLEGPQAKAFMDNAIAELSAAGVSGTPTFFVNGRKVTAGHGTIKTSLKAAIEKELRLDSAQGEQKNQKN